MELATLMLRRLQVERFRRDPAGPLRSYESVLAQPNVPLARSAVEQG